MKVIYTTLEPALEVHLKHAARTTDLKIQRTIWGNYLLKRYKNFYIWDIIAKIDTSKQTVFVHSQHWHEYEFLIKRLAFIVGEYAKPILYIKVRP